MGTARGKIPDTWLEEVLAAIPPEQAEGWREFVHTHDPRDYVTRAVVAAYVNMAAWLPGAPGEQSRTWSLRCSLGIMGFGNVLTTENPPQEAQSIITSNALDLRAKMFQRSVHPDVVRLSSRETHRESVCVRVC